MTKIVFLRLALLSISIFLQSASSSADSTIETIDDGHCTNEEDCGVRQRFVDRSTACDLDESIRKFREKRLIDPPPDLDADPYTKEMDENEKRLIRTVVENPRINCGLRYLDHERRTYALRTFPDEFEARESGYEITHFGRCGVCSSTQDLALYLDLRTNMTVLARQCAFFTFVSNRLSTYCFRKLGFTDSCARIWSYNAENTRKYCWWTCLISWIRQQPNNVPDEEHPDRTKLNTCLQCDEDNSGLLFKYYAGRTRRNSGIVSGIGRPKDEIREMSHCYY